MKITDYSANKLGEYVAGDIAGWPYRKGAELIDFFNQFGFNDVYAEGFPTRRVFAQEKIKQLNGKPILKSVIRQILDPRLWLDSSNGSVEEAVDKVNGLIKFDGYEVVRDGNFYKVRDLADSMIEIDAPFDASKLSESLIEEQIRKCREKVELGDYSGAITNARSLIEGVCINIEMELVVAHQEYDGDLNKLFTRVRKLLNLDPSRKDISDSLKQVLSGLAGIVSGLACMRNKMSDAHAGSYKPSRHHAKLAVNAAKTLADFLFETKAYQKEKGLLPSGSNS
ncbi:abortive infection family protein [Methylotenera sp. L2L1]|uniref:abortive infection family protein n=1 Tax=Methylotenera sp. L2L1 TaxID=1502770 RepID=UPI00056000A0|nr:abortive infection family protein [Methylotenera sp. L2L1]